MENNCQKQKCLIYARCSDNKEDKSISIPSQIAVLRKYVEEKGYVLAEKPYFDSGLSGGDDKRPDFQTLKTRVSKGDIRAIFINAQSRLFRNQLLFRTFMEFLKANNCILISKTEYFTERYFSDIRCWRDANKGAVDDEEFLVATSASVAIAYTTKYDEGIYPYKAKFGYKYTQKKTIGEKIYGKHIIFEPFSSYVLEMNEMFVTERYSYGKISSYLLEKGVATKTGKKLSDSTIKNILKDPFYCGLIVTKYGTREGTHKAIVSKELFNRVQNFINRQVGGRTRDRKYSDRYVLRGIATCPFCNKYMTAEPHKKDNGWFMEYYHCETPKKCTSRCCDVSIVENDVLEKLKKVSATDVFGVEITRLTNGKRALLYSSHTKILSSVRNKIKAQKEILSNTIQMTASGGFDSDDFKLVSPPIKKNIQFLELELNRLRFERININKVILKIGELAKSVSLCYQLGNIKQKKELLRLLFANILLVKNVPNKYTISDEFKVLIEAGYLKL